MGELAVIVNPTIKNTLKEIAKQSVAYGNTNDPSRRYYRRMLRVFKTHMTEDEQIYLLKSVMESLHYKNIVTDPDNVIQMHNLQMRKYFLFFLLFVAGLILVAFIFGKNESLQDIATSFGNIIKLLSI